MEVYVHFLEHKKGLFSLEEDKFCHNFSLKYGVLSEILLFRECALLVIKFTWNQGELILKVRRICHKMNFKEN